MDLADLFRRSAASADADRLASMASRPRFYPKGEAVIREGDRVDGLNVLVDGVAHAVRAVSGGTQQTVALFVAGDILDAKAFVFDRSSVSIRAASAARVAHLPRQRLDPMLDESPSLARWLLSVMASDNAVLEQWAVGMGRQSAYQRLAHLLCEISARMSAAALGDEDSCPFPLTQADLGDVLGLSVVHVNRMVQQLRGDAMIELRLGRLRVLDRARLVEAADFDPDYLGSRVAVASRPARTAAG